MTATGLSEGLRQDSALADRCVHELFEAQVQRTPDALAVMFEDRRLTYGELNARANQLAHHLVKQGIQPNQLVAICVERSLEMVIGLLGVLKAGGAYVPVDPDYPADRIAHIFEDAKPPVVLTQRGRLASLPSTRAHVLALDAEQSKLAGYPTDNIPIQELGVTPDHLVYVIYTSGSTGKPKGSMIPHGSLVNLWTALHDAIFFRYSQPVRVGLNAPIAFDSSLKEILQLLSGHALVLIPVAVRLEPVALLRFVETYRLDVLDCTPSQLELLLSAGLADGKSHRLSCLLIGGETIRETLWQQLQQIDHIDSYNVYGPTECTVDATICRIKESSGTPNIGRPITNGSIYILDSDRQPVPSGELYIGGAGVGRGYLNRPDLTAERFVADPFRAMPKARMYKTGDLGRWLPDGSIEFLGRNDFQVKVRGFRIELGEIESQLADHASVRETVVIVREDHTGDKRLVAYVVTRNGSSLEIDEVRRYLADKLPDYMIPTALVVLESFPLTPNGKLDRNALPAPAASRPYVAPGTALERTLAELWQGVVGGSPVGLDDSFFEIGGNSLRMAQVHGLIREQLQRDVPITRLFQFPTIRALAAFLEKPAARPAGRLQRVALRAQQMKGLADVGD